MKRSWCVVNAKDHVFVCTRCGGTRPDGLPCDLKAWVLLTKAFEVEHWGCKEGGRG